MKNILFAFAALTTAFVFAADDDELPRNPFWPIGKVPEKKVEVVQEKPEIAENTKKIVNIKAGRTSIKASSATMREWNLAKQQLKISDTQKTFGVDGKLKKMFIFINRKTYEVNENVTFEYKKVRFTWKVCLSSDGNSLQIRALKAQRLDLQPQDLKKK